MSKIKEIRDRLTKNPGEYSEIRLLIAKRSMAFFIMFYFTIYLFTIGGFSLGPLSLPVLAEISFHAYSALVIMLGWFLYEFAVYTIHVYADDHRWVIIIALLVSVLFVLGNLGIHIFF